MVLHGNREEGREELDSQREMERLTGFSGIIADEPADGQGASRLPSTVNPPRHGEYIRDVPGLISTYKRHHRERMELVWKALHNRARTLYEIIGDVIHEVPEGDIFLAISEILVHLEILLEEERAELVDPGPPALYRSL